MSVARFKDLMHEAEREQYAVGYFESWDLDSLQAIADAAEGMRSPVLLGFSGIYMHHPERRIKQRPSVYAALGNETCRQLSVPACLVFNESPCFDGVMEAIDLNFGMVMYADENEAQLAERVKTVVARAHPVGIAVEAELNALPGVGGALSSAPDSISLTDPALARTFVEQTGIDAFAVNIGQVHLHGRSEVALNLSRLSELNSAIQVPLVLHGASSVRRRDLEAAIRLGVRKINVGSLLKQCYFENLRSAFAGINRHYNPYEIIGSGLNNDTMVPARLALQKLVEDFMVLFGSAGKA
jgi:fructose/tagatose bisphosphate aldolase